ncbi:fatty acid desaturase [Thalassobium sp. R2A62]|jgi:fatty acid desaturase|uniref:fatty acid desaturase n=1 Tax=Thalassobium sp. R2A62 TaxID=633131 RepID=UPI0001B1D7B1|nr:fatty acid desaturase [Thalassobium sp. R2A62]EET49732.1 putative fatty acid desaturase [Thalassobium sp. R2A62]MDG1340859.1 fatty acid desaturase [Paracoccaceae bacterium]MDG2454134.1 fatty acid desaturase [Paracoccaceae bacterium]
MEAEFSRRKLLTPVEMRALTARSDLWGGMQMASHLGAIVVVGLLHAMAMGSGWVWVTGAVLGVLINFLYAAQHELSHATVFKTRKLNEFFGRFVGFFMVFPRDFDQVMHFAHHQYTQDWERDGELVREPYTLTTYLLWLSGITYWRNRIFGLVRRTRGIILEPFIKPNEEAKIIHESRLHMLGYLVIALVSALTGSWAVLTFWILPMVLTKPVHQLQNTIEHLGLSHESDILENTRSTRANALIRWLCWQMPYHTAHHTFPAVPFWQLKALNEKIEDAAGTVHRMGWIEFQFEVISKLRAKDESQYPMDEVWIVPSTGGRLARIPAE